MNPLKFISFMVSNDDNVSSNRSIGLVFSLLFIGISFIAIIKGSDSGLVESILSYTFYLIISLFGLKGMEKVFAGGKRSTQGG